MATVKEGTLVIDEQALQQRAQLAANIAEVQAKIAHAAQRAGRQPDEITLVAVSKTKPLAMIQAAYELGLRHFGENRVQEAQQKIAEFHPTDLHWHLIGHLQSNKVNKVTGKFACIHSIDSLHLAQNLHNAVAKGGDKAQPQPILLQVNISGEASKEGVRPAEAFPLARQIAELPLLELQGLMTIAPLVDDPETVRPIFRALRELREELREMVPTVHWHHLSMGMTDDYQVAIEEGATIVRVGRAIFGTRATRTPAHKGEAP